MRTLYHIGKKMSSIKKYLVPYIELLTKRSGEKLFLLLLAMMAMQTVSSIKHLYEWFMRGVSRVSLNAYYYLMSYSKLPVEKFSKVTMGLALGLIEESLRGLPVLLLLDDTLQEKYGSKFECWGVLHDHTKRNGSTYLKGHCFVALAICVPVSVGGCVQYLNIPVRFRVRERDESKLKIASEMVTEAMAVLSAVPTVVLLCDSWYTKGEVVATVAAHPNLELVGGIRVDTAMFELPVRTGKRGRPPKKGRQLCLRDDFDFAPVGDGFAAAMSVLTNLFENVVHMTATAKNLENPDSYRLFISTVSPDAINLLFARHLDLLAPPEKRLPWLAPLYLYKFRWNIEVLFYELKTFWSFGDYRLRSKHAIGNFVNLLAISYAAAKILPLSDANFVHLQGSSPQAAKFAIADLIRRDLFFADFLSKLETAGISPSFFDPLAFSDFFDRSS